MSEHEFKARPGVPMAIKPEAIGAAFTPYDEDSKPYKVHDGVAVVRIEGPLVHKGDGWWSYWDTYEAIGRRFRDALECDEVQSVVLKIDSPGGEVAGCFETVAAMQRAKRRAGKPVFVYVDESCYSAAYALAMVGDEIFLPRSGGVGSIGVITTRVDATKMDRKDGLRFEVIASGNEKTDGHPHVAITDDELRRVRRRITRLAVQFFDVVSESRKLSRETIQSFEAGVFTGRQAVRAGLADDVGSLSEVLTASRNVLSSQKISAARATRAEHAKGTPMSTLLKRTRRINELAQAVKDAKTSDEKRAAVRALGEAEKDLRASLKETNARIGVTDHSSTKPRASDDDASESGSDSSYESTSSSGESDASASASASASAASMSDSGSSSSGSSSSSSSDAAEGDDAKSGLYTKERLLRLCRQITGKRELPEVMGALNAMGKQHKEFGKRLGKLEAERDSAEIDRLIRDGGRAGKLSPSQHKWARKQSPGALRAYLDATKEGLVTPIESARIAKDGEQPHAGVVDKPTPAMFKIWKDQGFTEADYPKLLEAHNRASARAQGDVK